MGGRDWVLLIVLSGLWGATFLFARIAAPEVPPLTLALCRVGIAAALLGVWLAAIRQIPRRAGEWRAFAVMGFLNNVAPFSLIFWAQAWLTAGVAAIFNATTPFFVVLVTHLLTSDEKATVTKIAGCALGLAGVAVMLAPGDGGAIWPPAALATLLAALSYAFAGLYGRRFARMGLAPGSTAFGQLAASTPILLVAALLVERPWTLPAPSREVIVVILALASLSTALAYILYFRILASAGSTNLLLVTFLIPVSATLLGWLVLDERLALRHAVGMALIALGLAAIDGRMVKWLRRW